MSAWLEAERSLHSPAPAKLRAGLIAAVPLDLLLSPYREMDVEYFVSPATNERRSTVWMRSQLMPSPPPTLRRATAERPSPAWISRNALTGSGALMKSIA